MLKNNETKPLLYIGNSSLDKLTKECMRYVKCDTARILKSLDIMYLIIGFNRNTKDDEVIYVNQYNQRIDFDYVQELVIASGHTKKELIKSVKEYQQLCVRAVFLNRTLHF